MVNEAESMLGFTHVIFINVTRCYDAFTFLKHFFAHSNFIDTKKTPLVVRFQVYQQNLLLNSVLMVGSQLKDEMYSCLSL